MRSSENSIPFYNQNVFKQLSNPIYHNRYIDEKMIHGHLKIYVLSLLTKESLTGYLLMKKIGDLIGKKPSPGSIYPLLDELEKAKLITLTKKGRNKIYTITSKGHLAFKSINSKKGEIMDKMYEGMQLLDSLLNENESDNFKMMAEHFKSGDFPINELSPELSKLQAELFNTMQSNDARKTSAIKKILKDSIIQIRKLQ
jgi:DNA-binding PadR family transcriptional regulator